MRQIFFKELGDLFHDSGALRECDNCQLDDNTLEFIDLDATELGAVSPYCLQCAKNAFIFLHDKHDFKLILSSVAE